jgi:hypothetical protein
MKCGKSRRTVKTQRHQRGSPNSESSILHMFEIWRTAKGDIGAQVSLDLWDDMAAGSQDVGPGPPTVQHNMPNTRSFMRAASIMLVDN